MIDQKLIHKNQKSNLSMAKILLMVLVTGALSISLILKFPEILLIFLGSTIALYLVAMYSKGPSSTIEENWIPNIEEVIMH